MLMIFGGIALLLLLCGISMYNKLVRLRNQVKNAWSQIDVQLQRRYDLIPNLLETVKGYMAYEKNTLEAVIELRNRAVAAKDTFAKAGGPAHGSMQELLGAEASLKGSLGSIFALAENYPQLRASENMKALQEELASTENKVSFSRQGYNDQAMSYNISQQQFPMSLLAHLFGHRIVDLYEVKDQAAKNNVKIAF